MIEIINLTDVPVDKKLFLALAKKVLKGENKEIEPLSIAFVNPQEIQRLNRDYHGSNRPTDVLSFPRLPYITGDYSEVVICPEVVQKYAKKDGTDFDRELRKMLVHGILHVLGYDHEISQAEEDRMFTRQEFYLHH